MKTYKRNAHSSDERRGGVVRLRGAAEIRHLRELQLHSTMYVHAFATLTRQSGDRLTTTVNDVPRCEGKYFRGGTHHILREGQEVDGTRMPRWGLRGKLQHSKLEATRQ